MRVLKAAILVFVGLLSGVFVQVAKSAPVKFVGSFQYGNFSDGMVTCGGTSPTTPGYSPECWRQFSIQTGIGDPAKSPGAFGGAGSFFLEADTASGEIFLSEVRIGNWTTTFSALDTTSRSTACSPPPNSTFSFSAGDGSSMLFCNELAGLDDVFPPITFDYLYSQPRGSFGCSLTGLGAGCGIIRGEGWSMYINETSLSAVPEPGTATLVALAFLGIVGARKRASATSYVETRLKW